MSHFLNRNQAREKSHLTTESGRKIQVEVNLSIYFFLGLNSSYHSIRKTINHPDCVVNSQATGQSKSERIKSLA